MRLRRTDNGELALARRKEARAGCLRMMAAFPCDLPLQQRGELTRHTSKCHTPVHENRKKIAATAVAIDACDQKITPQLRRKTMQWLRRRSEPCELRGGLFLAAWSPIRKRSERRHAFSCGCGISDKNEMARSFVYLCAPLSPPAPLLPPPFLR